MTTEERLWEQANKFYSELKVAKYGPDLAGVEMQSDSAKAIIKAVALAITPIAFFIERHGGDGK